MQESDWVQPWGHWQRKCVVDAISYCMYRKSEVLQQPIPSHNDYRGITCQNPNVVEKMISIYKQMANESLLGRKTHGKTQKPKWVPKFNPQSEFNKK